MKPPQPGTRQTGLEFVTMTQIREALMTRPSKTLKVSKPKHNVTQEG